MNAVIGILPVETLASRGAGNHIAHIVIAFGLTRIRQRSGKSSSGTRQQHYKDPKPCSIHDPPFRSVGRILLREIPVSSVCQGV